MFEGSNKAHGYPCHWTEGDPRLAYTMRGKARLSRDLSVSGIIDKLVFESIDG
jgi:hypothetical protein